MANSMGSIMMNWTNVLVKQTKAKHRRKYKLENQDKLEENNGTIVQGDPQQDHQISVL